jgi:selenocysteine lyase/cysteine desulfurase
VTGSGRLGPQREAFAVPPGIAYFNTATLSPQLHRVREAGEAALERRSRPWTFTADDWFADVERLRELFAHVVHADADGIALVPATSYAFGVAARNLALGPGDRVLVLAEEYPSGVYTWQAATRATGAEILTVHREPGQSWTDAVLAGLDERVRVVSVPHVHWTDGALVDLDAVSTRTRELGAALAVDGSQSIGAMPFDVARLQPDFVTTVGYKWLLGPLGVSYLYVAEQHRDGVPLEQNWIARAGSEDFARLVDYRDEYQPGARRFDVGQRTQFELLPMAVAALEQVREWGVERIADALSGVTASVADIATSLGLDPVPSDQRGPHMLGVRLPEAVRAGVVPALAAADCYAAVRGEMLRLAPHLHVTDDDVDQLAGALARALDAERG